MGEQLDTEAGATPFDDDLLVSVEEFIRDFEDDTDSIIAGYKSIADQDESS